MKTNLVFITLCVIAHAQNIYCMEKEKETLMSPRRLAIGSSRSSNPHETSSVSALLFNISRSSEPSTSRTSEFQKVSQLPQGSTRVAVNGTSSSGRNINPQQILPQPQQLADSESRVSNSTRNASQQSTFIREFYASPSFDQTSESLENKPELRPSVVTEADLARPTAKERELSPEEKFQTAESHYTGKNGIQNLRRAFSLYQSLWNKYSDFRAFFRMGEFAFYGHISAPDYKTALNCFADIMSKPGLLGARARVYMAEICLSTQDEKKHERVIDILEPVIDKNEDEWAVSKAKLLLARYYLSGKTRYAQSTKKAIEFLKFVEERRAKLSSIDRAKMHGLLALATWGQDSVYYFQYAGMAVNQEVNMHARAQGQYVLGLHYEEANDWTRAEMNLIDAADQNFDQGIKKAASNKLNDLREKKRGKEAPRKI